MEKTRGNKWHSLTCWSLALLLSFLAFGRSEVRAATNVSQLGAASSVFADGATTLSNFTVPAGSNRLLVVVASDSEATDVTSVTYNGAALTRAVIKTDGLAVDTIWYRAMGSSLSSTTGNIVIATPSGPGPTRFIGAVVFQNVDQLTPVDGAQIGQDIAATTSSVSLTVPSRAGDLVFDVMDMGTLATDPVPNPAAGAGQTVIHSQSGVLATTFKGGYKTSIKNGAASVPMSWTTFSTYYAYIQLALNIRQAIPDTTPPTVASVSSSTSNGSYKTGTSISIQVAFNEAVIVTGTPTLTLNSGGTATYSSGSGSSTLTFNYTVAAGQSAADLDYSTTSSLALSGGTIQDIAGNSATLTLPTVGGANSLGGQKDIAIDTAVPTLSAVAIASNNANSTQAKVGNIVTVSFTASEAIGTPTVAIAGHAATASKLSGNNWSASYTMATGDTEGAVTFNIAFSDLAGNAGGAVSSTTNASSVTFDKTAPVVTGGTVNGTYRTAGFSYSINATGAPVNYGASGLPSGLTLTAATGAITGTPTQTGTFNVSVTATDAAGNTSNTATLTITIAKVALSVTGVTASNKAYDGTSTATIDTSSAALSGVAGGDAITLNTGAVTGTFGGKNVGTGITVTVSGFTISGAAAVNYTLAQPTLTASITAAPLTVTANSAQKIEGTSDPALTYALTGGALIGADKLSGALTRTAGEAPGTYPITQGTLTAGTNYAITFVSANFTIVPANAAPVAGAQSVTTNEDTAKPITLTGSDADGDALTYTIVAQPQHGTLSGTAPNLTYTPAANYHGADSFTFKVSDGTVDSAAATVSLTVIAVNDVPVADAQSVTTNEDTAKAVTLTGSDVDGDALTYTVVTQPQHGVLSGTAPNLTYTPVANYHGTDSFTFKVNDGTVDSAAATVSLAVTAVNDVPVADAQSVTTNEDTAKAVTLTGSDSDGDALTYTAVTQPQHGVLSGIAPNLTYTPAPNYHGTDSFTFKVNDGTVDSTVATIGITIAPANDTPVADAQSVTTNEDTAKAVTLTGSDVDGDALTYTIVTQPQHGTLSGTAPNLTYTPAANYHGADSFTFKVSDGTVDSAAATVSLTVSTVNDTPVADAQSVTTNEDTAKAVILTGSDVDGDALTYTVVAQPQHGTLSGTTPNLTYTPAANYHGADSFTFKVSDGTVDSAAATVSLTVSAVNDVPVADAQSVTTNEDTAKAVTLTGSDSDGDALTYTVVTQPQHGTLNGTGANLTYTPATNYHGADSFTFKVNDGTVDSAAATVSLTVSAVNDVPVADAQSVTTNEDTAKAVTLTGSDSDGDALTYTVVTQPQHGTLSGTAPNLTYTPAANYHGTDSFTFKVSDGTVDSAAATVSLTVSAVNDVPVADAQSVTTNEDTAKAVTLTGSDVDGDALTYTVVTQPQHGTLSGTAPNLTYTPAANYHGADSLTFKVNDGTVDSAAATVSLTVSSVNDTPVADAQSATTNEDTAKAVILTGSDVDGDALTYTVVAQTQHGTLSGTAPNLTYTPAANYHGADSFTFKVNDGTVDSASATVSLTVIAENDAPVADAQSVTTNEDTAKAITLTGSDVDGDALTYTVVTQPQHGTLSGTAPNLTYTPETDYHGTDSFTFKVNDATVDSSTATISITVVSVNDAPVAVEDGPLAVTEPEPATLDVVGNDTDADGDTLVITQVTQGAHGAVTIAADRRAVVYDPEDGYRGSDHFTYTIDDGQGGTATATVTVEVSDGGPEEYGQSVLLVGGLGGKGDPVTGEPAGTSYLRLDFPSINDVGQIAFRARIRGVKSNYNAVLAGSPPVPVARQGVVAPGAKQAKFAAFGTPVINERGRVAFVAHLGGPSVTSANRDGIWANVFGGGVELVARMGAEAPGVLNGARWQSIRAIAASDSVVAFVAKLKHGPGVTDANDQGLWMRQGTTTTLLLREGETLPIDGSLKVASFVALDPVGGSAGHGFGLVGERVEALVKFSDGSSAWLSLAPGATPTVLLRTGDAVGTSAVAGIQSPATGSDGLSGAAVLKLASGSALALHDTSEVTLAAAAGDPIEGIPGGVLSRIDSAVCDRAAASAFLGQFRRNSGKTSPNLGLFWSDGGIHRLIAQVGDAAPDTGTTWLDFPSIALPRTSGPVFKADLTTNNPRNARSLWAVDRSGSLRMLVRDGQQLQVRDETRKVLQFRCLRVEDKSGVLTNSFNRRRQLVYLAEFTDGTQAIYRVNIP